MSQLNLFSFQDDINSLPRLKITKRVRYKIPNFTKKYELLKDDNGIIQDQQHIYRYKTLYKIHSLILNYISYNPFEQFLYGYKNIGLLRIFYTDETGFTAEIIGTASLLLKDRLLIHLRLLKLLKQGLNLQIACKKSIKYWYKKNTASK